MIPRRSGKPARHRQSRPAQGQTHREANCRHRHHQPARNHPALGSRNRAADPSRHRLARPPHGQGLRPPQGGRPRPGHPPQNGSRDRRLFFRHQNCVAAQACEERARRRGRAGWRLAPSTPGSSGNSPAAPCTSLMPATPRARCCTICAPAVGCRITEAIQGSRSVLRGARLE